MLCVAVTGIVSARHKTARAWLMVEAEAVPDRGFQACSMTLLKQGAAPSPISAGRGYCRAIQLDKHPPIWW